MTVCSICYDNEVTSFICSYCKFQACQQCNQKFIQENIREPICMKCGKIWSREFVLKESDEKEWFFRHIGACTLEQEKMLLSSSQEEAFIILEIQKLSYSLQELPTNAQLTRMFKSRGKEYLNTILTEKRDLRFQVIKIINTLKKQTILYGKNNNCSEKIKEQRWILKCPLDCRGFISDKYQCGTCMGMICKLCNVPIKQEEEHKCNDENIKSAAFVLSLTKPCPKCMTLINKSGGCDQMFCVMCNTAFSWSTGKIETGIIHNPHYYEYLGTLGTGVIDIDLIACGEIPDARMFITRIINATSSVHCRMRLEKIHRNVTHIRQVLMPEWSTDRIKKNIDLRIKYLLNEIDYTQWEMKLYRREKKRMKGKAFYDLLQLVSIIMEDFTRQIFSFDTSEEPAWLENVYNILKQIDPLKIYYFDTLKEICLIHGGKIPPSLTNAFA